MNAAFSFLLLLSHIDLFTLLHGVVTAAFFLERYHLCYIRFLRLLDIIETLTNLVLLVLALYDKVVEKFNRKVAILLTICSMLAHPLKFFVQVGPFLKSTVMVVAVPFGTW